MGLTDWFKGKKKSTEEETPIERSQLELQLENIAEHESHTVRVSVVDEESSCHITYERGTDRALVDKVTALPMEVREQHGWTGEDYLEILSRYMYHINLEVAKVAGSYGGCAREDGFFMWLKCKSLPGLNAKRAIQLQLDLGQFLHEDKLSAPELDCTNGNLTIRLFYRGNHQQLDEQFARRMYEAFETVYDAVSVTAELSRRVEAAKQKLSQTECPAQAAV